MAGLVSYGSSDEEDNVQEGPSQTLNSLDAARTVALTYTVDNDSRAENQANGATAKPLPLEPELDAPLVGPALGPTAMEIPLANSPEEDVNLAPLSPYSANRALLRDLTLPTVPNYDIPPSPPGSPVASTNARFKHFLDLKKQGIHFNEKLAKSSALKNPSLMQKLMDFSDIDEAGQYATTLMKDLWDPGSFPEGAYKEDLANSQQKILKRREEEKARGQRETVDFVPATTVDPSSRSGTPGLGGRGGQKSAAERIMAGLDRGRSSSPQVQGVKRKTRFES